jgi:gamma-glutamyltranspeptidase/glutathione hydrolase
MGSPHRPDWPARWPAHCAASSAPPASLQAYSKNGVAYQQGELIRFPDLVRTHERIEKHGHVGFDQGETARLLVAEMARGDGMITEEDLLLYQARERAPVCDTYRGYEMLNILEGYDLRALGHNSAQHVHYMAEAMRRALLDRARFLADPDFANMPVERLTSRQYAQQLRSGIDPHEASSSAPADVNLTPESLEPTHCSVVNHRTRWRDASRGRAAQGGWGIWSTSAAVRAWPTPS